MFIIIQYHGIQFNLFLFDITLIFAALELLSHIHIVVPPSLYASVLRSVELLSPLLPLQGDDLHRVNHYFGSSRL